MDQPLIFFPDSGLNRPPKVEEEDEKDEKDPPKDNITIQKDKWVGYFDSDNNLIIGTNSKVIKGKRNMLFGDNITVEGDDNFILGNNYNVKGRRNHFISRLDIGIKGFTQQQFIELLQERLNKTIEYCAIMIKKDLTK